MVEETELVFVGFFAELGSPNGESMESHLGTCPSASREAVANYLRSGTPVFSGMGWVDDVLDRSKARVAGKGIFSDGHFVWPEALPYYVENYGVGVDRRLLETAEQLGEATPLSEEAQIELEEKLFPPPDI